MCRVLRASVSEFHAWRKRPPSRRARQTAVLARSALDMALKACAAKGVIFHSDHGSQFTALVFTSRCEQAGVLQSMGAVGSCYDNAMAKSYFATIECELLRRTPFATREETATAIFRFPEGFYNPQRRHSALGYLSPTSAREPGKPLSRSRPEPDGGFWIAHHFGTRGPLSLTLIRRRNG